MEFIDEIRKIVCKDCIDNFCRKNKGDLVQCVGRLVENNEH